MRSAQPLTSAVLPNRLFAVARPSDGAVQIRIADVLASHEADEEFGIFFRCEPANEADQGLVRWNFRDSRAACFCSVEQGRN